MNFKTIALLCAAGSLVHSQDAKQAGKPLFNGKTLAGWKAYATFTPPATGDWTVVNGAISCPGISAGWLGTDETYANFTLRLQFRGAANVNSGVFLRSQKEGAPHQTGYELQIWDHQPAGYNTGSLVGSVKAGPTQIIPDDWNNYEVTAQGDHFVVVLNGKTILDAHDSKHASGVIGFQCQKDNKIDFRNVRLLALP